MLHLPEPDWIDCDAGTQVAPMEAVDTYFLQLVKANPKLTIRIAHPSKHRSHHMARTLAFLRQGDKVSQPDGPQASESACVAMNGESSISSVLGNRDGLNLAVCSEAFAMKMLSALREEIILARRQRELEQEPGWTGVPLIATPNIWENGDHEQLGQDTSIGEMLLGEMSDVSRVLFPSDANTAVEALRRIYSGRLQIGCIIVPSQPVPVLLSGAAVRSLFDNGAAIIAGDPQGASVQLVAIGTYQLQESLKAAARMNERKIPTSVAVVVEPGRLREPRDKRESKFTIPGKVITELFPARLPRVVVTHTRPELMTGVLRRIDSGPAHMRVLGYKNRAGKQGEGTLFANGCSWAHIALSAAQVLGTDPARILEINEMIAALGRGNPHNAASRLTET